MKVAIKPLSEITQEATQVLCEKIGAVNTIRFINQFSPGFGNYTEERKQLFQDISLDDIVSEIKQNRKQKA